MRKLILLAALYTANIAFAQKKQITLEDIWQKGTFSMKSVPGFNAMKDGLRYTRLDGSGQNQQINIYNLADGKKLQNIFSNSNESFTIDDYNFSADEQKMLLLADAEYIYRRSVLHHAYLYDLKTKAIAVIDSEKILHPTFSPDGSKVAFVKNNNLFYKDLATGKTQAITTDGKWNEIINGNCDWVYEEEFEFTRAYDWSPDGKHIAFYRFNERKVPEYTLAKYYSLYPDQYTYKYPKAGEPNSIVSIKIYDLKTGETVKADMGKEKDQYIPRIKWTTNADELCIYRMNRHQNKLELLLANADDGATRNIYEETNKYYIEINDNLQFINDGESFIFNSEKSGYNHFYKWNWKTRKLTPLTSGHYDIDQLIGIDEANNKLYYTAAEASPIERKLYSVDFDGNNKICLTNEEGTHAITTIAGYQFFLDKYSRLNQPPVYYLRDKEGKIVRTLEDNSKLVAKMKDYELGKLKFVQLPGAEKGVMLNAWMMLPPNFDEHKKYPVLMFQYSGPGSQQVADRFPMADYFWHQMLAQKGYIIVCADGTGTGFRGEDFKKKTYLQLGNLESNDQIAIGKHLGGLPYVDKSRIGIWGWSFGGFMSSTCIMKGNDVFKMAIAIAPVTNWRYYDNIYTERYMRTPAENPSGYDANSPETMVDKLKGKFLLVHGTGDDNVHFQNQVMLVDALIKANKEFESEYYPNRNHGIYGGNTRLHLYNRMTKFILENL